MEENRNCPVRDVQSNLPQHVTVDCRGSTSTPMPVAEIVAIQSRRWRAQILAAARKAGR